MSRILIRPAHIKQAAYEAIAGGETKYTPTPGIPALREAVRQKLQRENRLPFAVADIMIANGAKQVIFNAFAATLNDGDEVIVPVPYWPTFPDSVRLTVAHRFWLNVIWSRATN